MQLHSLNVKCGVEMDQFVVTGLINLEAKCGELDLVHRAFWEVNDLQYIDGRMCSTMKGKRSY